MLLSPNELIKFREIINTHIGIEIADKDRANLAPVLRERMEVWNIIDSPSVYFLFLETDDTDSQREWKLLANRFRVGESYFLRDSGQMDLLAQEIFPELLQRNRIQRSLCIMSAGCSSGEEAYSLAILLDRLVPANESWDIEILGVDIDEHALDVARAGYYTEWSFRRIPDSIRNAYFEQEGSRWRIHSRIQANVRFMRLNMVKDLAPALGTLIAPLDFILCRNVFIYFGTDTIKSLTDIFAHALNPDGYLMTGHGELRGIKHPLLQLRSFATSVVYQRLMPGKLSIENSDISRNALQDIPRVKLPKTIKSQPLRLSHPVKPIGSTNKPTKILTRPHPHPPRQPLKPKSNPDISELRTLFLQAKYAQVVTSSAALLKQFPEELEIWQLAAQAHANLGQYAEAESCCNRLLKIDVFHAPAYFLLAHIALENGDEQQRRVLLKKALYLDHTFVAPQLELAEIFSREGDTERANKMHLAVLRVLESLPEDAAVDMLDGWKVQDLLAQMRELLDQTIQDNRSFST